MRIVFLSSIYPRPYDPTRGVYCEHLCKALADEHEVRVVSPRGWLECLRHGSGGLAAPLVSQGGRLEATFPCYFYPPKVLRRTYGWCMWASIRRGLRKLLDRFAPDFVLSYWTHPDGEVAVRAARHAGVPSVVIVGGSDVLLLPREPARRRCVTGVLRQADAVLAVSDDLRAKIVELGIPGAKVHVVMQGIDTSRFRPGDRGEARKKIGAPADARLLLWVGRIAPVKGLEVLLEAARRSRAQGVDFHLYLLGDGPQRAALEAEGRRLGLADRLHFVGTVGHERLPDWYRAADLTVLSSHSEGIPNVLRESLACGVPYVATSVGGIPELSQDPANILVPPGDPAAFAEAVQSALARGPVRPGPFTGADWNGAARKVLDLIRPLLRRDRAA